MISAVNTAVHSVRPHSARVQDHISSFRYRVFLRPGPRFGVTALQAMDIAHRQFGFQSAVSYPPPHTTLVGSIAIDGPERELENVLEEVLQRPAVPLWNKGLGRQFEASLGYNVNEDGNGQPNLLLRELVREIFEAVELLRVHPVTDLGIVKRRRETAEAFEGHLTVVGHDGIDNPELVEECLDYLRALDLNGPATDIGNTVSLFRFHSEDWGGRYWETMRWTILRSWRLG